MQLDAWGRRERETIHVHRSRWIIVEYARNEMKMRSSITSTNTVESDTNDTRAASSRMKCSHIEQSKSNPLTRRVHWLISRVETCAFRSGRSGERIGWIRRGRRHRVHRHTGPLCLAGLWLRCDRSTTAATTIIVQIGQILLK